MTNHDYVPNWGSKQHKRVRSAFVREQQLSTPSSTMYPPVSEVLARHGMRQGERTGVPAGLEKLRASLQEKGIIKK